MAVIGGASAFIESTLAQIYKIKDGDSFRGGPAYYIQRGLAKRWLGCVFSVLLIACFAYGFNSLQTYNISTAIADYIPNYSESMWPMLIGIVMAALTAAAHLWRCASYWIYQFCNCSDYGGRLYFDWSHYVLYTSRCCPGCIYHIFKQAFDVQAIMGGLAGSAIVIGIKRGLFSNEAGMGS